MSVDSQDIETALFEAHVLEEAGRPIAAAAIRACVKAACTTLSPTERERIGMCGPDPVRNEELGL